MLYIAFYLIIQLFMYFVALTYEFAIVLSSFLLITSTCAIRRHKSQVKNSEKFLLQHINFEIASSLSVCGLQGFHIFVIRVTYSFRLVSVVISVPQPPNFELARSLLQILSPSRGYSLLQ